VNRGRSRFFLGGLFLGPFLLAPAIVVVAGGACTEFGTVVPLADAAPEAAAKDGASDAPAPIDDAGFDAACVTATRNATAPPAYLQLVIDGSVSMAGTKWIATKGAISAYVDELLQRNDPTLGLGLLVFADSLDPSSGAGPYPTPKDSAPRAVDQAVHDALRARIDGASPAGPSVVFGALGGGYSLLEGMPILPPLAAGGKKAAMLLADGPPSDDPSFQGAIDLAHNKRIGAKIRTFSVGLGPFPQAAGYSSDFMGDIAIAGGTGANPQCNPHTTALVDICHIQVTPEARAADAIQLELVNVLRKVHAQVSACEYTVEGGTPPDPTRVNLLWVDAQKKEHVLSQGPLDGWTVDPESSDRVLLHGATCGDVSGSEGSTIRVLLGCATRTGR
jgi:hypothetical protein